MEKVNEIFNLENAKPKEERILVELSKNFPSLLELEKYISELEAEGAGKINAFEVKEMQKLPCWNEIASFFEKRNVKGFDNIKVVVIDDEDFWKNFYGSNDSKSSYKPKTIILKKSVFEKEKLSTEDVSWLVHEIGHLMFYDNLGDQLEQYMEEYHKTGKYTDSKMEQQAFELQFEFLKSEGVSKEECVDFVNRYLGKAFADDEYGKIEELKQITKYIEAVYS